MAWTACVVARTRTSLVIMVKNAALTQIIQIGIAVLILVCVGKKKLFAARVINVMTGWHVGPAIVCNVEVMASLAAKEKPAVQVN